MSFRRFANGGNNAVTNPATPSGSKSAGRQTTLASWRTPKTTPGLIASASFQGTSGGAAARHGAIGLMASFGEVLNAVPQGYREVLRAPFRAIANLAAKWVGARHHYESLLNHQAKGTLPPSIIGMHYPTIELTSEYKATVTDKLRGSREVFDKFVLAVLDEQVLITKAQVDFLDNLLNPELCSKDAFDVIRSQKVELAKSSLEPRVIVPADDADEQQGWVTSASHSREFSCLTTDLPVFIARIIAIEKERYFVDRAKKDAKTKLKEAADVEMGDATLSTRAISDIVKKELAAGLKKLKLVSDEVMLLSSDHSNISSGKRVWSGQFEEEGQQAKRRRHEGEKYQENKIGGLSQSQPCFWEEYSNSASAQAVYEVERQREAEGIVASANINLDTPASWPDEVLFIPYPLAIRYLLRSATPAHLEAVRFRAGIHLGPDVSVPDYICIQLSAGLKYMPRIPKDPRLVLIAYDDFCDRLRWKITWIKKSAKNQAQVPGSGDKSSPYDPDYRITKDRSTCDNVESYIERGLDAGRKYCQNYIDTFAPGQSQSKLKPELVRVNEISEFLLERDYIVLPTDKNLGSSVVTRQWFIENTNKLLSDPKAYMKITLSEVTVILEKTIAKVGVMADLADTGLKHPQLAEFLRQFADPDSFTSTNLPTFYGIAKIHKTPVKMRPIVPCHSAAQNPAAKYVSKSLKPVLAKCEYVLRGTKDLAIRLAKTNFSTSRKKFLVSYDVVAYYPNLPLTHAIEIVTKMWKDSEKPSLTEQAIFKMGIELACRNLVCQFDGQYFLQLQGIAMGVACSPDISNLFGAAFENIFMASSQTRERIPFYGRFIDDGFMIVYADSKDEALQFCKDTVNIGDLDLTWDVSDRLMPFLDMLVYIDPVSQRIEHRPYRKARSHLERIPFVSHHPQDVKRGTFLGEMSRMAVLSSNPSNYLEALKDLQSIYVARGYPSDLVRKWTKDNCAKRWHARLEESSAIGNREVTTGVVKKENLLILKTTFNPIWDTFNIHELSQVVVNHWLSSINNRGWYNKQLFEYASRVRPNVTHALSWPEVRNIAKSDGFVPSRGEVVSETTHTFGLITSTAPNDDTIGNAGVLSQEASSSSSLPVWEDISFETTRWLGHHVQSLEGIRVLDVRKVGLTTSRWMLSRKKHRNLADRLSKVKRAVLSNNTAEPDQPCEDIEPDDPIEEDQPSPPWLDDDVAMYDAFDHYDMPMDEL